MSVNRAPKFNAGELNVYASPSDVGEVSRTLPIAFLAPDIVAAILHGRQAIELTPRQLLRIGTMPHRWDDQRRRLGCQNS